MDIEPRDVYDSLRPYQRDAVDILNQRPRALHFDDMGLGKTVTTLTSNEMLLENRPISNTLILCPTNALYVWQGELEKWFGKESIVYKGTPAKRKKIWKEYLESYQCRYLITTFGMLREIMEYTEADKHEDRFHGAYRNNPSVWDCVIADEIHSSSAGLLNYKNQGFKRFEKFARTIPLVRLLTGTPIRQGVVDAFAPLNIMNRMRFKNYWQFINTFCITFDGPFGKEIDRRPRDVEGFRNTMQQYMIRRMKTEVLDDLPGKQRQPLLCDMSKKQEKAYTELVKQMFTIDGDNIVMTPNAMTLGMRLRQLLVCPKMLGIDDYGTALETIGEMGADLIENGKSFAVFSPFKKVMPFVVEVLTKSIPGVKIYMLHGGMTGTEFAEQWQGFQNNPSTNKVLLCVIKSGASFQATTASTAFFLGYEWDFNLNDQAEDRLCRLGQKDFVNIHYMLHKGTIDEVVVSRLNDKQEASNWIIGNDEQFEALMKRYGATIKGTKTI